MSRLCRLKQGLPQGKRPHNFSSKHVWIVPILILTIGLGAFGANELLKGQLTVTEEQVEKETATSSDDRDRADAPRTSLSSKVTSDKLIDEYGDAAKSPAVATAIRKAERQTAYVARAKEVSDRYEALSHGDWRPGDDPMRAIEYGYVPPGMSPQQAAFLYNTLPANLKRPHVLKPGSPEWIAKMTNSPIDLGTGVPFDLEQEQIQATNQAMLEHHMREQFGPVYVPPLHRDHNSVAAKTSNIAIGTYLNVDHQMSLIQPQYAYDGGGGPGSIREVTNSSGTVVYQSSYDPYGRQTQISGTGPVPDFGYAGYYYHAPSGLSLAVHRAYSPTLGRWLSRDPIQDPTFAMAPRSPGPRNPDTSLTTSAASSMASLQSVMHDPIVRAQMARLLPHSAFRKRSDPNFYPYVLNNPISFSDPLGLAASCPTTGGGGCHPPIFDPELTYEKCQKYCEDHCITVEDFLACEAECWEAFHGH